MKKMIFIEVEKMKGILLYAKLQYVCDLRPTLNRDTYQNIYDCSIFRTNY